MEEEEEEEKEEPIQPVQQPQSIFSNSFMNDTVLVTQSAQLQFMKETLEVHLGCQVSSCLLYRGSRDGWEPRDFHKLCDDLGATVSIIKVKNGRLCGGFTSLPWKKDKSQSSDPESFLFSLTNLKKYPLIEDKEDNIQYYPYLGPCFDSLTPSLCL